MKTHLLTIVPILAFFLTTLSAQAAPPFVTYAGQVASGGQPFNGTGQFKFAFVNADANLTYWSQDGTSSGGSEPTGQVTAPVNGGYYSILLGNTAITGMGAIDPTIFKSHSDVHLRVWFSDGVAAFQEMTPHRPFASVPYALNAGVAAGSIDSSKLDATIISYLKPEVFLPKSVSVRTPLGEERVTLNSEATGKYLSYQWKKNGSVLPGETNSMLVIADANATHDGNYSVVVSNAFGSVESPSYQLASTPNSPPTNLNATALLTIAENQPIGTVVGEFNASDPDAGASLTYHLVSGAGDGNNTLFTLEANGTLKTATTFDYESNASTYSIRVQAKDEFNATVEGNFTVTLTDVLYEPSQPPHTVQSAANLEMLWVQPGTFTMGSPTGETGRSSTETEHNVTLTKGFYLGKYEVTQAQYQAVMTGNGNGLSDTPSQWPGNPNRPVEKVSWDDVQIFLTRLNSAEQTAGRLPAGWFYVLPTESQWEYACRAGTTTAYSWGATIASSNANYSSSGISQTCDVGQYAANPWGFFDMHGNVLEWTADRYGTYPTGNPVIDPPGAASGSASARVGRGGSWYFTAYDVRCAFRFGRVPAGRDNRLGFRLGFQQQ
jgi:formylglycine-generating enzyme